MVYQLECSPLTSEVVGLNLGTGDSSWKVGSYLSMPGDLQ